MLSTGCVTLSRSYPLGYSIKVPPHPHHPPYKHKYHPPPIPPASPALAVRGRVWALRNPAANSKSTWSPLAKSMHRCMRHQPCWLESTARLARKLPFSRDGARSQGERYVPLTTYGPRIANVFVSTRRCRRSATRDVTMRRKNLFNLAMVTD